jgi:hypothetical protein
MNSQQPSYRAGDSARRGFQDRYARVMRRVWEHPDNDQRASVREWLTHFLGPFRHVLDVGPGDAYYLEILRPTNCTFVEPNPSLASAALARAKSLGIPAVIYPSVHSLLKEGLPPEIDLVVMIHVLLYLTLGELDSFLPAVACLPLLMVYPWEGNSTTIQFEDEVGVSQSRDRIQRKNQLLPSPKSRAIHQTHLRLPVDTTANEVSFLVAHTTLDHPGRQKQMAAAHAFVEKKLPLWRLPSSLEIPQAQVLESYHV